MSENKKIAVVGAGLSGLACAIRLAKTGYKVTVYEKNKSAGGKIEEIKGKGFRFDTGASILTLPELIEDLFEFAGENINDFLKFKKLKINARFYFPDGSIIDAFQDINKFADTIEKTTGENKNRIIKYLKRNQKLYNLTSGIFVFSPFHNIKSIPLGQALKVMIHIFRLKIFTTMHTLNKKCFKDERVIQFFDRYATYNGSNPFQAPATLCLISHLEHNIGSYLPEKGMYQLIAALVSLAKKLGVEFRFNTEVEEVKIENKKVNSLVVNGEQHKFEIVINNTDIFYTYKNLLKGYSRSKGIFKQELSSSSIIFYWGVSKIFKKLQVHNIIFSNNYKEEFDHVFSKKLLYKDPSIYIYVSSKLNPADAPNECENWLVMINAPVDNQQNWNRLISEVKESIVNKINQTLKTDIEKYIVYEKHSSPETIEKWTGSYRGSLYGPSSRSIFSTFTRHANFKRSAKGLYFAGGSVHPGGGIPLCLASSEIVSKLVAEDFPII